MEIWISTIDTKIKEFLSKLKREGLIKTYPSEIDIDRISEKVGDILFEYSKEEIKEE